MKAKKHLGQHFLIDNIIVDRIVQAISDNCSESLPLIEIGPGQGVLTKHLIDRYDMFKAIELDSDMVEILQLLLKPDQLVHSDFLRLDLSDLFDSDQFNLVGNFPYNISSQIVFKVLEYLEHIPFVVGMFQKELAERIAAGPGTKANGILSLNAQAYYEVEILFHIGPEAFDPPPKVNSSIILMRRKENLELGCDYQMYRRVIKQAFQQRRKKLRNTLKSFDIDQELEIYQKRPEQLGVQDFVNIVNSIQS